MQILPTPWQTSIAAPLWACAAFGKGGRGRVSQIYQVPVAGEEGGVYVCVCVSVCVPSFSLSANTGYIEYFLCARH